LFDKIHSRKYDSSCCFLCSDDIDVNSQSAEHVIPKWLQNKYNLWSKTISLLNKSHIQYRYLKVPCCIECNNKYLRPIEDDIKDHTNYGFEGFKKIDKLKLYYWLGKIYYGILYKELFLLMDKASPNKGTILDTDFLDQLKAHYLFLQGIRGRHNFKGFFPASIMFFETQIPNDINQQWDFVDNILSMFIGIRIGNIGIISVLQDGGSLEEFGDIYDDFRKVPLHPIQFRELCANIAYRSTLFNRVPKFISHEDGIITTQQLPLGGLSSKPLYDEWSLEEYAEVLSFYTGYPLEVLQPIPGKVMSWMKDENGEIKFLDINNYPFE